MNPFGRILRYTNTILTCGLTGAIIYIKMNKYEACEKMLDVRKGDPSLLLPPHMKTLVNEIMDDMKLTEEVKSHITLFLSETPDFQQFLKVGEQRGLLGIPQYFVIDPNTDVKFSVVKDSKPISVKQSESLRNALHLSTNAKKFAIARELYELLSSKQFLQFTIPPLLNLNFLTLDYLLEKNFAKQIRVNPYNPHFVLFLMGITSYAFSYNIITHYFETSADFLACGLGKSYIEGGIEYYKKVIEKNKALKKIEKNAPYSEDGDINYSRFGKPHMPLEKRLLYLQDLYNEKAKSKIWWYIIFAN